MYCDLKPSTAKHLINLKDLIPRTESYLTRDKIFNYGKYKFHDKKIDVEEKEYNGIFSEIVWKRITSVEYIQPMLKCSYSVHRETENRF